MPLGDGDRELTVACKLGDWKEARRQDGERWGLMALPAEFVGVG